MRRQPKAAGRKGTMAKEICISSTPHETRLAILEDDQLAEIYYERENEYTLAGSIYNGRVTRVLPGMQSAFVDLGLERDAFLYVTDFVELEDEEDTDEIERATATAGNQPPIEVKHVGQEDRQGQRRDRGDEQRRDQGRERSDERRRDQGRPVSASQPTASDATQAGGDRHPVVPELEAVNQQNEGPAGGKRWRGRRHRRGRGAEPGQFEPGAKAAEPFEFEEKPVADPEIASEIQASEAPQYSAHRAPQSPATIVLPGESLSKYGGTAAEAVKPASESASRRSFTSKPSTLIESPLKWDGSGLLPGESLSRRRGSQAETAPSHSVEPAEDIFAEPIDTAGPAPVKAASPAVAGIEEEFLEEEELVAPQEEAAPPALQGD